MIVLNVFCATVCLLACYMSVFFVVGHFWSYAAITLATAFATGCVLYITWYTPLKMQERADQIEPVAESRGEIQDQPVLSNRTSEG